MTVLHHSNYWVIAGIALMVGEMLTGGFFLMFVALGSFGASLAAALGQPLWLQLAVCAGLSLLGVTMLRKVLQVRFLKSTAVNADVGKEIQIDQAIPPHKRSRITYQGTTWEATNLGAEDIRAGDRVVIVGIDGISLLIRKVN